MSKDYTLRELAERLNRTEEISLHQIYEWAKGKKGQKPRLSTHIGEEDGVRRVRVRDAEALIERWESSRSPIEFCRAHDLPTRGGTWGHMIERKVVKAIYLFAKKEKGYRRILKESDRAATEWIDAMPERITANHKRLGTLAGHRWDGTELNVHRFSSKEARAAARKKWRLVKARKLERAS